MDLPSHPETDDADAHQRSTRPVSRATWIAVAVVAALLAVMVILHLVGVVGPNAH
ncbi:MAG: hypothetical protein ACRD2C_11295 [Acidimicrobiales bacterium]